jgi:hypothetical protein
VTDDCQHPNARRVLLGGHSPCFADVRARQLQLIEQGMAPHGARVGAWDTAYDEVKAWGSACLCPVDVCDACLSIRWCGPRGKWGADEVRRAMSEES